MNQFSKIALGIVALTGAVTGAYYLSSSNTQEPFIVSQAIPASANVNANGMLTWSMDIDVPPGIKNVQPALSINYTSQNVSGLLGTGFDLEGLSEITRASATEAQDGFFGSVSFNNKDRFDLDGNRLMVMKGTYGAANSIYHTQLESWNKVVAVGQSGSGPQSFQVWSKSGMYYEYGNTTDSRVLAIATTSPSVFAANSVRQWLVNKCRDLHGNTLTVSYTQSPPDSLGNPLTTCNGQGQSYPLRIDYTSNDTVKALRSVQFIYEARPDSGMIFSGGAQYSTRARMTAIRTFVKDEKGDSVLVREVRMTYQKNAPLLASRMESVQVRANDCAYEPTTFNWSAGQDTLISKPITWTPNTNTGFLGDFNGDGKNDILQSDNNLYYGTATGLSYAGNAGDMYNNSMYNFVGDFNGDGLSDFLSASSGGGKIYYYNTQSKTFSSPQSVNGLVISDGCYPNTCVWQGDFNGDGMSDICSAMGSNAYVNFGNATNGLNSYIEQNNLAIYKGNTYAADFNGDGLTDIFSCNPSTGYLTISNWSDSTGFRSSITISNMNFTISSTQAYTWVADYNGDGLADILARGTDSKYRLYYANGHGFQSADTIDISLNATAVWPADFNHDGMMDFFVASSNKGKIYYSDGLDFNTQDSVFYDFQPQYTWLGDFDGDGLTDLFNCYEKEMFYGSCKETSNQDVNQQGNLIISINNGIGSEFTATYKPITDSTVYDAGSSTPSTALEGQRVINAYNAFPLSPVQNQLNGVISIQQAMYVVSDWTVTDGRGAMYPYKYEYGGAKYDMTGYGFLGYEFSQTTNVSQGSIIKKFTLQDFPYTGMTDSTILCDISGNNYTAYSYQWDSVPIVGASGIRCYEVLQSLQNTYLYNKTTISCKSQKQYWYDSFGNARLTATTGNTSQPNTLWSITTYANDTSNWQLGYITSTKQSSDSSGSHLLSAIKLTYSAQRDVDSLYTWYSSNNTWLTRAFGYDPFGNQIIQTSYAGDTTQMFFDNTYHTFPVKNISPKNAQGIHLQTSSVYDPAYGKMIQFIDPNSNKFEYVYDALGRFKESWIPDSTGKSMLALQTNYLPDSVGFLVQQITVHDWASEKIDTSSLYYDGLSRKYQMQRLGWNNQYVYTQQQFNASNQITATSWSHFSSETPLWWRNYYDAAGQIVRAVSPFETNDSIVTKIAYQGLQTQVTHAAQTADSTVSTYTYTYYNNKSCVTNFVNASGTTTTYTWDLLGRIHSATDANGHTTAASFNSLDLNDWYYSVSFDTTFFYYDPIKQTTKTVDALGDTVFVSYDNLGRTTSSVASRTTPITYLYDQAGVKNGLGNLCNVSQDNGATTYSFAYDALSNTVQEQVQMDGNLWQQEMSYNPDLSIGTLIYPNQIQATYQYNRAGQPVSLNQKNTSGSLSPITTVNEIDAKDNWLNYTYGNGVITQKGYYTDGTLQSMLVAENVQSPYLSKNYAWNKKRLISGITDLLKSPESETYSYNPTGRLLGVESGLANDSFAYDPVGNLIWGDSVTFNYSAYQVKSGTYRNATIYTAQYNAVGQINNRSITDQTNLKTYRYTYNGYGEMDSVFRNDSLMYTYTYDYAGIRNRTRSVTEASVDYQVFSSYSEVVTATQKNGSCNFSMGGIVFATQSGSNPIAYYTYNQNNSTVLVTNAFGDVSKEIAYSPYGKFRNEMNDSIRAQYKFNGKEYDERSGLYYFDARYYDPFTSRFVSADNQLGGDLITPDALNNYAFVNNSPITLSDPSGHTGEKAEKVAKLLVVGSLEAFAEAASDGGATPMIIELDGKKITEALATTIVQVTEDATKTVVSEAVEKQVETTEQTATTLTKKRKRCSREASQLNSDDIITTRKRNCNTHFQNLAFDLDERGLPIGEDTDGPNFTMNEDGRPAYSADQVSITWTSNMSADGKVFCARTGCGKELSNVKVSQIDRHGKERMVRQWDMGHKPKHKYEGLKLLFDEKTISEQEYKTAYRNPAYYHPECISCNRKRLGDGTAAQAAKNYLRDIKKLRPTSDYFYLEKRIDIPFYLKREQQWLELEEQFPYRRAA